MATQSHVPNPTTNQPTKRTRELVEVKAPEMFQFTREEPVLEGVYLGSSLVKVKGKTTTQYMLQDDDGRRFSFLATYDLGRKIQPGHVGHWMFIRFEGEDPNIQTQGSPMKIFKVTVAKDPEPGFAGGPTITNEDIPF